MAWRVLNPWLTRLAVCSVVALSGSGVHAAENTKPEPAPVECRWAHDPITIDGKGDEPAWKSAQPIDTFRRAWEGAKERPPKAATKARLLWDREFLYFYAELDDFDLYAVVKEHDGRVWTDDAFELFFKPAVDKPGYYEFNFSPANVTMDMFLPGRRSGGWDKHRAVGDFAITSATVLKGTLNNPADRDTGWTVEGRIPWKSFLRTGGRPAPGEQWTFAPCRVDISAEPKDQELSSAAILKSKPTADFHHYEDYLQLKFIGPQEGGGKAQARYGIETLLPLTTSKVVGSPDAPKPFRVANAYPKLKVPFPVCIAHQPDSDRVWVIGSTGPWPSPPPCATPPQ